MKELFEMGGFMLPATEVEPNFMNAIVTTQQANKRDGQRLGLKQQDNHKEKSKYALSRFNNEYTRGLN
jgi:hypothetical protein